MAGKSGVVGRKKAIRITEIIEPEVPGVTKRYSGKRKLQDDDGDDDDDDMTVVENDEDLED
jgi:hypothetical protein